jgi:hypothetical protein
VSDTTISEYEAASIEVLLLEFRELLRELDARLGGAQKEERRQRRERLEVIEGGDDA